MINKVIFINLKNNQYTRTRNYYNGFLKIGIDCLWHDVSSFGELIKLYREIKFFRDDTTVVATSRSQLLSIYSFFLGHRIVLDAGLPLWDGVITSRRNFGFVGWNMIKVYLTDFLSFHLSKHVIFETLVQESRVSRMFFINQKKISHVLLGLDENRFPLENFNCGSKIVKKNVLNIIFRGGNQVESGISILIESSKILKEDKRFVFTLVTNDIRQEVKIENVKSVVGHVSDGFIKELYLDADLIIGQLLNHKRLSIAIPHKFYEAAYFSKPYLTAHYGLMKDFVDNNLVFGFKAGDVESFIENLNFLYENQPLLFSRGKKLGDWYKANCSQIILAKKFYNILLSVNE